MTASATPSSGPPTVGETLTRLWSRLSPWPGGRTLFSWILGWVVPYSGSIRPRVEALEPGCVRVSMQDRRGVRNHLRCLHALALANLGELAGGLSVAVGLPPGYRFIITSLQVEYLQKARGAMTAMGTWRCPAGGPPEDDVVAVSVRNAVDEEVVRVRVGVRIGRVGQGR